MDLIRQAFNKNFNDALREGGKMPLSKAEFAEALVREKEKD